MRASDKVAFLHDADASQDERMMEVISIHGNRGVGFFWRLVERMRAATDYRLDMRLISGISHSLSESLADAKQMLETFETVGLFAREDDHFLFSPSLRRRMEAYDAKRSKCIEAGKKGGVAKASRSERLADAKQPLSEPLAYKTKLNTIEPNTTEPKGSDPLLDPSTSLDGTVPDPKPAPRKVPKQVPIDLAPPATFVDPDTRKASTAKHLRLTAAEVEGLQSAYGQKLYNRCAAAADDWLANNPKRLRELKDHFAFLRQWIRKDAENAGPPGRPAKLTNLEKAKELMREGLEAGND